MLARAMRSVRSGILDAPSLESLMPMLDDEELSKLLPAETNAFPSPIPTQFVSSDEFMPTPQTERQKQVDFAPTYFVTGTKIIVKKSSGIKGYDDLKGKTVVFTQGTTNEPAMKAYNDEKKLGINFLPSKDHAESFLAVQTDRAVAFPMDDILLYGLKAGAKNPDDFVPESGVAEDPPWCAQRFSDTHGNIWRKLSVRELLVDHDFMNIGV